MQPRLCTWPIVSQRKTDLNLVKTIVRSVVLWRVHWLSAVQLCSWRSVSRSHRIHFTCTSHLLMGGVKQPPPVTWRVAVTLVGSSRSRASLIVQRRPWPARVEDFITKSSLFHAVNVKNIRRMTLAGSTVDGVDYDRRRRRNRCLSPVAVRSLRRRTKVV